MATKTTWSTADRYTPVPHYKRTWEPLLGPRMIGPGIGQIKGVTIHRLQCKLELKRRPSRPGLVDSQAPSEDFQ